MVEYTGASQWYNACLTIAAGWLKTGGRVSYSAYAWPSENVRSHLNLLGLKAEELEKEDKLRIWDWYTATLGRKSNETLSQDSLKVADLSIMFSREVMAGHPSLGRQPYGPNWLRIADNGSTLARFNEEKAWVEFRLTRDIPSASSTKSTAIVAFIKGLHSSWAYEQLEAAVDGIIDFRLDETSDPAQNLMRIKAMRNMGFDGRWHKLKIAENLEVTLEK
jgi:KaiC/GvpD/RAD55 family RecA-like ATPase